MTNKPIIWKKEDCLMGECKKQLIQHWWSLPFTTPGGLCCECYHCHKTRFVKVE